MIGIKRSNELEITHKLHKTVKPSKIWNINELCQLSVLDFAKFLINEVHFNIDMNKMNKLNSLIIENVEEDYQEGISFFKTYLKHNGKVPNKIKIQDLSFLICALFKSLNKFVENVCTKEMKMIFLKWSNYVLEGYEIKKIGEIAFKNITKYDLIRFTFMITLYTRNTNNKDIRSIELYRYSNYNSYFFKVKCDNFRFSRKLGLEFISFWNFIHVLKNQYWKYELNDLFTFYEGFNLSTKVLNTIKNPSENVKQYVNSWESDIGITIPKSVYFTGKNYFFTENNNSLFNTSLVCEVIPFGEVIDCLNSL